MNKKRNEAEQVCLVDDKKIKTIFFIKKFRLPQLKKKKTMKLLKQLKRLNKLLKR
jgi:hypothetical protein